MTEITGKALIERAALFAAAAHAAVGQRRKYTGRPYIEHPAAVAAIVESVEHTPEMVAAAWLHDVIEDTGVTLEDIREAFGIEVQHLVYWLTDVSRPEDGNRRERKAMDRDNLAAAPAAAQTVKLADVIDNAKDITAHDPDFAVVYKREIGALLHVMTLGDPGLYEQARELVA